MVADLDSVNQAERWRLGWLERHPDEDLPSSPRLSPIGTLSADAVSWFSGVLRSADLLSDTILVTDAQLLDGIFFQALGPARVHRIIGRVDFGATAITVLARGTSLEESLRRMALDGWAHGGFRWSVLAPWALGTEAVGPLPPDPSSLSLVRHAPAGAVARRLAWALAVAVGRSAEEPSFVHLARAWQSWIDAERDGLVALERYAPAPQRCWEGAVAGWELPRDPRLRTRATAMAAQPVRSAALALLERTDDSAPLTTREREELEAWYKSVYLDFLATNNRADWIDIVGGRLSERGGTPTAERQQQRLVLRGSGPELLGEMPPEQFELFAHQSRGVIARYRERPTQPALDGIAYAIAGASVQYDREADVRRSVLQLAVTLASLVVVFVLGLFSTNPALAAAIPLIILAVSLATEVYTAWEPLRSVRRSQLRSIVSVGPAGSGS